MRHVSQPSSRAAETAAATERLERERRREGSGGTWITPTGELDLATAPQLAQSLDEALARAILVIIDLRELTFMDSAGLHAIVHADARARRSGQRLVLIRGAVQITRLLELVGVTDELNIVDLTPD